MWASRLARKSSPIATVKKTVPKQSIPTVINEMNSSLEESKHNRYQQSEERDSEEDMSYSVINDSQFLDSTINH